MTDINAAFVQKILNIAKRKLKPNIHHDGQTDDLGARFQVAKRAAFCYPKTLNARSTRLNKFSSYSAFYTAPIPKGCLYRRLCQDVAASANDARSRLRAASRIWRIRSLETQNRSPNAYSVFGVSDT